MRGALTPHGATQHHRMITTAAPRVASFSRPIDNIATGETMTTTRAIAWWTFGGLALVTTVHFLLQ